MKNIQKLLMTATLLLFIVSCKPTFNAAQVLQSDENR